MNQLDPRMQRRIQAMNDVFGLQQEDVAAGLSPMDIASLLGRSVDSVTGAPTRSGIGAAITGEDPVAAAGRQFGASPDNAPSFGMVEDMVLDPTNLIALGGKSLGALPARLAALNEVGAVGRFNRATKRGNVVHAAPHFAPYFGEMEKISSANKVIPKGAAGPLGSVKPGTLEIGPIDDLDLSKFSREDLAELAKREVEDAATVYQNPEYVLDESTFRKLRGNIKDRNAQLDEIEALTKKTKVRKLFDPELDQDLQRRLLWAGEDDESKLMIAQLMSENRLLPGGPLAVKNPKKIKMPSGDGHLETMTRDAINELSSRGTDPTKQNILDYLFKDARGDAEVREIEKRLSAFLDNGKK